MNVGDRVIYDGCPFIIKIKNNSSAFGKGEDVFRLHSIKWNKEYPFIDAWIHEKLITIDHQYYRQEKLKELGI
jgi:hypothetical protein